jgi:hypothetical protein
MSGDFGSQPNRGVPVQLFDPFVEWRLTREAL